MVEWSRYGLEDFLLFSASTYQRLFELHNAAWWPAPLLGLSPPPFGIQASLAGGCAGTGRFAPLARFQRCGQQPPEALSHVGTVLSLAAACLRGQMQHAVAVQPAGQT